MRIFKIVVFVVIATALVAGGLWYNHRSDIQAAAEKQAATNALRNQQMDMLTQFQNNIKDVVAGTGETARNGDMVTVNYKGALDDGAVFDSSYTRGTPFTFTLGAGQVIQGWDLGLVGMKVGGTRTLVIPPDLGYGTKAVGPIPANATLHFTVELLKVEHPTSTTP